MEFSNFGKFIYQPKEQNKESKHHQGHHSRRSPKAIFPEVDISSDSSVSGPLPGAIARTSLEKNGTWPPGGSVSKAIGEESTSNPSRFTLRMKGGYDIFCRFHRPKTSRNDV
jgi:hypothetical protein